MKRVIVIVSLAALAGCKSARSDLPSGPAAYVIMPPVTETVRRPDYVLGPLDVVNVNVFQEPDVTIRDAQIDVSGDIAMPLIGHVRAQGLTTRQLGQEITNLLAARYIVDPKVSVAITSSVSQRVTVEGNVLNPGVYDIGGSATLLEGLARARGTTRVAKLEEIVIFRNVNGQRMGAVFNVSRIRKGLDPDPEVLGGDVIVVGFDAVKGTFRDFLTAAPAINIFRRF